MDETTNPEVEEKLLPPPDTTNQQTDFNSSQVSLESIGTKNWKFYRSEHPSFSSTLIYWHKLLRENQDDEFIETFQNITTVWTELQLIDDERAQTWYNSLLLAAIFNGSNKSVEVILQKVEGDQEAIRIACTVGNYKALQMLLVNDNIFPTAEDLLNVAMFMSKNKETGEINNFIGCLEIIYDSPKLNYINENDVMKSKTIALASAVVTQNDDAVTKLLNRGAYMDSMSIKGIRPALLEEFFDKCITTNDTFYGSFDFEIIINYNYLIPWVSEQSEEMLPLKEIADTPDLIHLLNHPLLTSFLFLKWHKLSFFFYINFISTLFFCTCIIAYILIDFNSAALKFFSILGLIYLILRETIQCFTMRKEMFSTSLAAFANLVEFILIISTILTLSQSDDERKYQPTYAVLTILLCSVEIYLLVGSLPILTISTHMLMLKAVCESFVKSFSQYLIFFITFGICFHMVFRSVTNSSDDSDENSGYFNSTLGSILKAYVMTTGEFDSGNIKFNSPISYGIFVLFVAFMAIVLLNLLNGLAVSDTQIIRAQAELNGTICRTYLLSNLDRFLTVRSNKGAEFFKNIWPFNKIFNQLTSSFEDYIHGQYISIKPNDGNKILIRKLQRSKKSDYPENINNSVVIPINDDENEGDEKDEREVFLSPMSNFLNFCSYFNHKCSGMDSNIVKSALAVIENNQKVQKEKNAILEQEIRLKNIERTGEMILSLLQRSAQGPSK